MNNISLFNPSLFQHFFSQDRTMPLARKNRSFPHSEINEDENQYTIKVSVPGISKEDLQIRMEDHYLYVSSNKVKTEAQYEYNFVFFIRHAVDINNASAELSRGILHIALPKREKDTSSHIEIIEKEG